MQCSIFIGSMTDVGRHSAPPAAAVLGVLSISGQTDSYNGFRSWTMGSLYKNIAMYVLCRIKFDQACVFAKNICLQTFYKTGDAIVEKYPCDILMSLYYIPQEGMHAQ